MSLRADFAAICEWIKPGSRVLDLGCGDGTLLQHLVNTRQVQGYGIEIDSDNAVQCIRRGVNVIQRDIDVGLADFHDNMFDYVIMTQTVQAVHFPDKLVVEMLRVGREGIITFPNFGHWLNRLQLAFGGRMPVNEALPNQWYNTPNIHMCTVKDFENLCRGLSIHVLQRRMVDVAQRPSMMLSIMPNLFASSALYRIQKS